MNKLSIILRKHRYLEPIVEVDGKVIPLKKNNFGGYTAVCETEESDVTVKIYSLPNELLIKHWFLRYLFYYFISLFGIFDWSYSSNGYSVSYVGEYHIEGELVLNLKWNGAKEGEKALFPKENDSDFNDNDSNVYVFDKRVKRRYRGTLAFKILSWLLIGVAIGLIAIL